MMTDITFNILIIALLVLANAFFVAAEYALVRVRRTRIDQLIAEGVHSAVVVRQSLMQLDRFLSSSQVGVTLASLALGAYGEPFLAHSVGVLLDVILPTVHSSYWEHGVAGAIALCGITFLHVSIAEIMPRSLALQYPETVSLYLIRPMQFCIAVFLPLTWLFNGFARMILRVIGVKPADAHALAFSEEELLMLLSESKNAGVVTDDEQRMLQRVFKFHDKTVREIMTPRPDMDALELRASTDDIKKAFDKGYSRMPVFDGDLNNIKGIVYVKDLLYTLQDPKLIMLVDLLREPVFVPETMPVSKLLKDFQKGKVHMAIVVDEFGDTAGLVTLEDVIEEIVGEIQDEYDYEPAEIQKTHAGALVFDGKTSLARFKEIYPDFEPPEGSFETVAGMVFQLAGRVPKEGDEFPHGGLSFNITKRDGRRLRKIAVASLGAIQPHSSDSGRKLAVEADVAAHAILQNESGEEIPLAHESVRMTSVK